MEYASGKFCSFISLSCGSLYRVLWIVFHYFLDIFLAETGPNQIRWLFSAIFFNRIRKICFCLCLCQHPFDAQHDLFASQISSTSQNNNVSCTNVYMFNNAQRNNMHWNWCTRSGTTSHMQLIAFGIGDTLIRHTDPLATSHLCGAVAWNTWPNFCYICHVTTFLQ